MKNSVWCTLLFSVACVAACASGVARGQEWRALTDVELDVVTNGVLDFSRLNEAGAAGQYGWARVLESGHIGFERKAVPVRFFCASMAFSPASGGFPDKADTDRIVAQLKRTGYNLVRLHYVDAMLMSGRMGDFDFDPVQFDRLHYLMSRLKSAGVYWVIDVLTSENGAYGNVMPNRWERKFELKTGVYFDKDQQAHWRRLASEILGRKNPYSGSSIAEDPATLGVILVNEGSLGYLATISGKGYPKQLAAKFNEWLGSRYLSDEAFNSTWAAARRPGEAPASRNVDVPDSIRAKDMRGQDFMRFVSDMERETVRWMSDYVRTLGFRGLITSLDNWSFHQADVSRSALSWVDMHAYHALPSAYVSTGSRIDQTGVVASSAKYVRELTNARQWGKPFTVSEYGQPFWNQWRRESSIVVPAYAAHQDWDMICMFADNPVQLNYLGSPYSRKNAMYPFGIGADPILRTGERLAALLFKRGDVRATSGRVKLQLSVDQVLSTSAGWSQTPEAISRLSLLTGYGIEFVDRPSASIGQKVVTLGLAGSESGFAGKLSNVMSRAGLAGNERIEALRSSGILPNGNLTDAARGVFQTDTGEILLNSERAEFLVSSPRTAAVSFSGSSAVAGPLTVRDASTPALIAVSALEGDSLKASNRMLVFVLTDAINSGMQFADDARTTLQTLGKIPPQVMTVRATVRIEGVRGGVFRAYPLSLAGKRRGEIPLKRTATALELVLDTGALPDGPALMFELVRE